ncbi:FAD/NAD(P)-binding domain-containing protein [Nemania serpens]|nr:FAD/NAD(P)-binding domain-containing protein [Nemania serpens]
MYVKLFYRLLAICPFLVLSDTGSPNPLAGNTSFTGLSPSDVIERDVIVIGGGSSGTYSAVRLRDHGKSVIVVEKKGFLGGHAETWTDPLTNYTIDGGVVVFSPIKTVKDYFARFNVSLVPLPSVNFGQKYIDFGTGKLLDIQSVDPEALNGARHRYAAQLDRYPELQRSFDLTYPVHADLLLSFQDFALKYKVEDLVPQTFISNQGYAPILDISMLYIFKYFNADQLLVYNTSYLTTARHNIRELYEKAADFLSPDVLLNSEIISMERPYTNKQKVRVLVKTPQGIKLIIAKKLLSTPPPLLTSLKGYDLSEWETGLFKRFFANGYYSAILNNTGLNVSLWAADSARPFQVPDLPGLYTMSPNQGFTQIYYGSPHILSEDAVKADIVHKLRLAQQVQDFGNSTAQPEWLAFYNHAPFNLMVSNEDIRSGFYKRLFALQGERNTFYNGAAWHTQDLSALWQFTDDYVLPILLEALDESCVPK